MIIQQISGIKELQSISGGDYSKYEDGKIVGYYIQKGKIDEYGELSRYYDSLIWRLPL